MLEPNTAAILIGVGIVLACIEFCRPGWVVPGIAGGIAILAGTASLTQNARVSPMVAIGIAVPVSAIVLVLLRIARRARRNKRFSETRR